MKPYTFMTTTAESSLNVNLLYSDNELEWNEFSLPVLPSHQWFQHSFPTVNGKLVLIFVSPSPYIKFIDCSSDSPQGLTWFEGVSPHTKWKGFYITCHNDYLERNFSLTSNDQKLYQNSYPLPTSAFIPLMALTGWSNSELKGDISPKRLIHDLLRHACSSIEFSGTISQNNKIVKYLEDLVEKHLEGGFLPKIEKIASDLRIHKVTLQAKFKQVHQKSLYEYYLDKKLERACELLQHFKVQEVAERLGYTQSIKFIIVFKKRYNITPKQFIQQSH